MTTTPIRRAPVTPAGAAAACGHWSDLASRYCGATGDVRLYPIGPRCPADTPNAVAGRGEVDQAKPAWLACAGCHRTLDPAAAAGVDGEPGVFDRHPGCEPARRTPIAEPPSAHHTHRPLRVIQGGKTTTRRVA